MEVAKGIKVMEPSAYVLVVALHHRKMNRKHKNHQKKEGNLMKIYIIQYVAYGDRTKTVQVFNNFFITRKSAEETAQQLRACGHKSIKIVPLVQE